MSKFVWTAGLFLGSLVGVAGTVQAGEHSQPIQVESAQSVEGEAAFAGPRYRDLGSYTRFTDALPARNYWRSQGFAANIVTRRDGNYTVRVFDK